MNGPPNIKRAPIPAGALESATASQSSRKLDTKAEKYSQSLELAAACRHVLALGDRVALEFVRDLSLNSDVTTTCRDYRRIPASTFHALVHLMRTPIQGGRQ